MFHDPLQRKEKKNPGIRLNLLSLHPKSSEKLWKKPQSNRALSLFQDVENRFGEVRKASEGLTFVGTEAIFAVFVEVVRGGAP